MRRSASLPAAISRALATSLALLSFFLLSQAAMAKQPKVKVCHVTDGGSVHEISVAAPAVQAHLGHGDSLPLTFYADLDGDGFGAGAASQGCSVPPGFVQNDDDCDDGNAAVNPAAPEVCNGIDDNCSGDIDEGLTFDNDGDGFTSIDSCLGSANDCDDGDPAVNPGAAEACNGIDDNCSGGIDEGLTFDDDGDGFSSVGSCEGSADDCDDGDPNVNPGETEVCNSVDDDCDGAIDEGGVCGGKKVFVTGQLFDGNFGGLAGADAQCQQAANLAGLSGTYLAWISGRPDFAGQSVVDRFTPSAGAYVLLDGTKVADDFADLTDGSLDNAINRTELNAAVTGEMRVWTNTMSDGDAWDILRDCALGGGPITWTCTPVTVCPFESGKYGMASSTGSDWTGTASSNTNCAENLRLYCFEQ